ncbi:MAG: hypothetical protein WBA97_27210 [Actinophytocola sp.]|uniref:hypothetical protein n=1 Tax=Actinophytocola sp. TaxID=1872138 RepID=UPI003C711AA7
MDDGERDSQDLRFCRSQRHGGVASRTAAGLSICTECRDEAEENLVELPQLYDMCAYMLDVPRQQPRERVSGHRPRGIVLRDAVVSIRSDILGVLASWCGLVASERGVTGPDELSIPRLSTFVQIHFGWLTAHPAGADFTDELAALAERARAVLTPDPLTVMPLGPCPRPGCGWTLRAEGHPPKRILCEAGHEWPPDQWLLLRGGRLDSSREGGE